MMRYTKEIFDILSKGGFISQNSISQQRSHLYDAIEDDFNDYQEYFSGIGFLLEGGNGYYYFSRTENRMELTDKVQRLALWIDRVDFLFVGLDIGIQVARLLLQLDVAGELFEDV